MSEQENITVVRQTYEAFGRGDLPGVLSRMEPDVPWVTPGPADLPTAGRRQGVQQVEEFFAALMGLAEIVTFVPGEFIAQGDKVVVLGDETARIRATGTLVDFRWVHIFTVRDGKIAAFEEIGDVSATVADLRSQHARV